MDRYRDDGTETEAAGAVEAAIENERAAPDAAGPNATAPDPGWATESPVGIDNPANLNAYQGKRGTARGVSRATDEPYEAERHNQPDEGR